MLNAIEVNAIVQPSAAPRVDLRPLLVVTLVNYAAQVPYYIHNDYTAHHPLPGLRGVVLLGITLAWFLAGLRRYERNRRWGYELLISFLAVEAVFYGLTILSGIFITQLRNRSLLIDVVFVVGYVSGLVAAVYWYRIRVQHRLDATNRPVAVADPGARIDDA